MNLKMTMCAAAPALILAVSGCGNAGEKGPPPEMAVPVLAAAVVREPIRDTLSLVATIMANESVEIRSQIEGVVDLVGFEEGQAVTNGQLLLQLDQRKRAAALAQAEAEFALAESTWKRHETMLADKTISRQEFDQAASSFEAHRARLALMRAEFSDTRITAPFDGLAGARHVSPGQVVNRDTVLTALVDSDPVKADFQVPERFIGVLRAGQGVELGVEAYPGETFRGEVYFIAPAIETESRTVLVKARIPNTDARLRPGMFGRLDLIQNVREDALVIPENALVIQGDAATVLRVDGDSRAQATPVTVGIRLAGRAEILEGLQEGDRVITEGVQKAPPGSLVQAGTAESSSTPASR